MLVKNIYKEDFFYRKIIKTSKERLEDAINNKESNYYSVKIPKKGGVRRLKCINNDSDIYQIQSNLSNNLLNNIPLPRYVFGFIKNRCYSNFLEPHIKNVLETRYYLRVDVKDFFDSITDYIVRESLSYYFTIPDEDTNNDILEMVTELVTLNGVLPQGAVTSPVISNIVFRPLDIRIHKYCSKLEFVYSRYADDLLFSSGDKRLFQPFFIKMLSKILKSKGLRLNYPKIKRSKNEISLNGFVVGNNIRVSRRKKYDINKLLYMFESVKEIKVTDFITKVNSETLFYRKNVDEQYFQNKTQLINYLCGYRSFLIDWLYPDKSSKIYNKSKNTIKRIEKLIDVINEQHNND